MGVGVKSRSKINGGNVGDAVGNGACGRGVGVITIHSQGVGVAVPRNSAAAVASCTTTAAVATLSGVTVAITYSAITALYGSGVDAAPDWATAVASALRATAVCRLSAGGDGKTRNGVT